jgi:hypothetical protein
MRSVDNGSSCGRPFQEAAALLVDPEGEPDDAEPLEVDDEPEPEPEPLEDDDDDDAADSAFFSPEPFEEDEDEESAFAFSRLSVR